MKQILKFLSYFIGGLTIGVLIVIICVAFFTDIPLAELYDKLSGIGILSIIISCIGSIAALFIAIFAQILLHESGHLIMGLLAKFKFVSFRVANLTLLKENGKYKIKKFFIAGTGGQCLLSPPSETPSQSAVSWYLAGGSLINIVTAIICFILWLKVDMPFFFNLLTMYMWVIGLLFAFLNGLPLRIGGITNDGYNIMLMRKDASCKQELMSQLYINAANQQGIRPRDMPDEWFVYQNITDYKNIFLVTSQLTYASRLIDKKEYEAAYTILNEMHNHANEIIKLLNHEIDCELLFLELHYRKDNTRANNLYTDELKKYVEQAAKTMSSKQRILCSMAYYVDNNHDTAIDIYNKVLSNKQNYLMLGEVEYDLDLMKEVVEQESFASNQ